MASTRKQQQQVAAAKETGAVGGGETAGGTRSARARTARKRVQFGPPPHMKIVRDDVDDAAEQQVVVEGNADASADTVVAQSVSAEPSIDNDGRIEIETTRFGRLTVERERVIQLPKGLLGFPNHTQFALIQTSDENYFFWLQSVDEPQLAFVVADPAIFFKDYEVPIREETQSELELSDAANAQVFVICNKVEDWLTGNLLGPIVINAANRRASQVVLTEKKWTTRQPLMRLNAAGEAMPLAKSA